MSRVLLYITLSLALHFFAVLPLLAEQFVLPAAAQTVPSAGLALPVPRVVQPPKKQAVAVQPAPSEPVPAFAKKPPQVNKTPLKPAVKKPALAQTVKPLPQPVPKNTQAAKPATALDALDSAATVAEHVTTNQQAVETAATATKLPSNRIATAVTEVISTQPRFAKAPVAPAYPAQAKRRQQQGIVWVEVRLDRQGKQVALQVLRSSGVPSLDQAALSAVKKWQFLPELHNGIGVPSRVHIPIEFAIKAQP